jgi:hypothetical protein
MAGSWECGKELSSSVKCREFLYYLRHASFSRRTPFMDLVGRLVGWLVGWLNGWIVD